MREMASEHNTTTFIPLPIDLFSASSEEMTRHQNVCEYMTLFNFIIPDGDGSKVWLTGFDRGYDGQSTKD